MIIEKGPQILGVLPMFVGSIQRQTVIQVRFDQAGPVQLIGRQPATKLRQLNPRTSAPGAVLPIPGGPQGLNHLLFFKGNVQGDDVTAVFREGLTPNHNKGSFEQPG
ncbi:hypothetical protein C4J81_15645 [Deltaproteobacteria bacterium Smac51]|nr:hypothetical protein C4J81_15645 [Deltaproteobacteria bacterium Smac51]